MSSRETLLYVAIAESVRRLIASGMLRPGDRLPTIREQARQWGCTPGTVSRAYALLAQEGLVAGRRGAGTCVAPKALQAEPASWRWAALVNLADKYLLEAMTTGFAAEDAQTALSLAVARWEELQAPEKAKAPPSSPPDRLRFVGSHDLAVEILPRLLLDLSKPLSLDVRYVGSLGGLIALSRDEADLAGVHLWDAETGTYNVPFVRRLLPGRPVTLLTLFHRSLGLIVPAGNPQGLHLLSDLAQPGVRFVNRQSGSGTRVWLDAQLKALGVDTSGIAGYGDARTTHLSVARAVANGEASAGLGIQAAASSFGLGFVPLTHERYDLALPQGTRRSQAGQQLVETVRSEAFGRLVLSLGGYDLARTGEETLVE